jgi:apolipoprotein N-acyltransferase
VLSGAKALSNHTNDAWFFDTAAPYQHFIMNVFRAVETRKTVMVAANSGISGIVGACGVVVEKTSSSKKAILTGTFLQNDFKTFYTKHADIFSYICLAFLSLAFIVVGVKFSLRKFLKSNLMKS